jgi:tetratricopeptide (TPR) repeat protein
MRNLVSVLVLLVAATASTPAAAETTCNDAIDWKNWDFAVLICDPEHGTSDSEKVHLAAEQGWAYDQLGQRQDAMAAYVHAIDLDPGNAEGYMMRARSHLRHGEMREALADADDAVRLDHDSAAAFRLRGSVQTETKDYGDALDDLDRAVALDPKNAMGYGLRGVAYYRHGDESKAETDFAKAAEINPACKPVTRMTFTFKSEQPDSLKQSDPKLVFDCPE